jgi:hypothetical protein
MSDEQTKPKLEIVPPSAEELDEEEREFRSLRRDLPGVKGTADVGIITISVGRQPSPKNTFYRTCKTFRPVVPLVNVDGLASCSRAFLASSAKTLNLFRSRESGRMWFAGHSTT